MKRKRNVRKKSTTDKTTSADPVPSTSQSRLTDIQNKSSTNASKRKANTPKRKNPTTDMIVLGKKFKVSKKVLREIRTLQTSTHNIIPKLPFARLVKEIFLEHGPANLRIQAAALEALQVAVEMYMMDVFEDSNLCALHCKRVTLFVRDMQLALQIRRGA
ncbi:Core histone H2A/H2B/H3/H4 [Popillia japonica]|uniref:Core histone H2A/H2B/H3/H4 n=1 Tax=Popillia japonica TaxID=7064 RepID=A0AAW1KQG7_POPJA